MAIEVSIEKTLGNFQLNVEFHTEKKRIGILGESGCGKSMTLKCIAGIETPDRGRILLNDRILYDDKHNIKPQKRNVGYLFQNYALFPTMTVAQNIAAGVKGKKSEKAAIVKKMIRKFHLEGLEDRLPGELSGGQQQRTALARIMAYEPEVILLDEPFSALDGFLKDRLQQEMKQMFDEYEGTVILVSHSRDELYRFSEEMVVLHEGKSICQGETKTLFLKPEWMEAARLSGCKNIAKIEKRDPIDRECVFVPDWDVTLHIHREVPEDISYVGIRAHEFIPVWKDENGDFYSWDGKKRVNYTENLIKVNENSMAELPFERQYYLKTKCKNDICWFVQRDKYSALDVLGMPDYLYIPEEMILLLR